MGKIIGLTDYKLKKEIEKSINNICYNKVKRDRLLQDLARKKK